MKYLFLICLYPSLVFAASLSDESIHFELNQFFQNPAKYYEKSSTKKYPGVMELEKLLHQDSLREKLMAKALTPPGVKSRPGRNDQVENLLRGLSIEKNINTLHFMNLMQGEVATQPWSDDYWAIYKGILGARYASPEYSYLGGWKEAYDFIQADPAPAIFESGDSERIAKLSPSEKFDLLLHGSKHPLTKNNWGQGKYYFERSEDGNIETWMGICHGWAAASYMAQRPQKAIEVMSFDNKTKIKFYPADIKALASLLWASTDFETNFVGGRCNDQEPDEDEDGRLTSQKCLDSNPATFHLSLVNGIGRYKKSFIMDTTYDYEVWNQPITSYEFKYFNPLKQEATSELKEGMIKAADFKNDPYKKHRGRGTEYIVGVALKVTYGVEISPFQSETDSVENDSLNTVYYYYDLEVDKNHQIIGGEWYNRDHPDFLWTPHYSTSALTSSDYYLLTRPQWDGKEALPEDIRKLAAYAARKGSPLAYIVNSLIKLAR